MLRMAALQGFVCFGEEGLRQRINRVWPDPVFIVDT